jgi:hypothetical protein
MDEEKLSEAYKNIRRELDKAYGFFYLNSGIYFFSDIVSRFEQTYSSNKKRLSEEELLSVKEMVYFLNNGAKEYLKKTRQRNQRFLEEKIKTFRKNLQRIDDKLSSPRIRRHYLSQKK